MARLPVLPLLSLVLPLLPPVLPLLPPVSPLLSPVSPLLSPVSPLPPPHNVTLPRCPPGRFRCAPHAPCVPVEWQCDGHPDCDDGEDERGCGSGTAAEPSPGGAEASATPVPEGSAPSNSPDRLWILVIAGICTMR
ncbi:CD320 antigen isoform X2 [Melopsittacus undulatus]|uniref:CD320 antigen isoform X2 n=1 Tax=Melopsittacus undulatus TaxID=13146 RepID=UPI00146C93DB|nr:CD320 antigen isoform X2 [Melopsittacus undulatus]